MSRVPKVSGEDLLKAWAEHHVARTLFHGCAQAPWTTAEGLPAARVLGPDDGEGVDG